MRWTSAWVRGCGGAVVVAVVLVSAPSSRATAAQESAATKLRSSDKWVRKSAVEALARTGGADALEALVGALDDPAGEVADTAEWLLGQVLDGTTLDVLVGPAGTRARDPWLRRRAWGALGRIEASSTGVGATDWRRGVGDREPSVRVAALRALESAGAREEPGVEPNAVSSPVPSAVSSPVSSAVRGSVAKAFDAREPAVAAGALFVAVRGAWEVAPAWLTEALADRRPELRAAGLSALRLPGASATRGARGPVADLRQALEDAVPSVRAAAVRATDALDLVDAAPLLVDALAEEQPLALRTAAWRRLQERSGLRHSLVSPAWRAWAEAPVVREVEPRVEESVAVAVYRPPSDRFVLLLDLSGSVWREREDGSTPRDDLVAATRAVVAALDERTRFDVGVFTGEVELAFGELERATPTRVRRAADFLDDASRRGPGDAWGALLAALADPDVDTVVLLTDGVPTGGRRHRLELVAEEWHARCRLRPVALEVLLVGAPARVHRGWQEVVRGGGGRVLDATVGEEPAPDRRARGSG